MMNAHFYWLPHDMNRVDEPVHLGRPASLILQSDDLSIQHMSVQEFGNSFSFFMKRKGLRRVNVSDLKLHFTESRNSFEVSPNLYTDIGYETYTVEKITVEERHYSQRARRFLDQFPANARPTSLWRIVYNIPDSAMTRMPNMGMQYFRLILKANEYPRSWQSDRIECYAPMKMFRESAVGMTKYVAAETHERASNMFWERVPEAKREKVLNTMNRLSALPSQLRDAVPERHRNTLQNGWQRARSYVPSRSSPDSSRINAAREDTWLN